MKPRELYSGQPPAAMAQMGQGISEAYANVGRLQAEGYNALGRGIGSGLQAIGEAYAKHKGMTADVAAKEKAIDTFLPYLPEEKRISFETQINAVKSDTSMGLQDKKAFYDTAFGMLGNAVGHQMSMEKVAAETSGKLTGAAISAAPEYARIELEKRKLDEAARVNAAAAEQRAKGLEAFGNALGGGKPASPAPAAPIQSGLPEKNGTQLTGTNAFGNLDIVNQQRIQNSHITPEIWDSYDEEHRNRLLADPNNIIWRK